MRDPKAGEDARAYAGRERAGRILANRCFSDATAFYRDVEQHYGTATPEN